MEYEYEKIVEAAVVLALILAMFLPFCQVQNEAGQRGLNVIFIYGHNHGGGPDNYLGGSTNYIPEGDILYIAAPFANYENATGIISVWTALFMWLRCMNPMVSAAALAFCLTALVRSAITSP